eukprot:6116467-Lingulodinium_polyedra.AAC.1
MHNYAHCLLSLFSPGGVVGPGPPGRTSHGAPCGRPAGVGLILADRFRAYVGPARQGAAPASE